MNIKLVWKKKKYPPNEDTVHEYWRVKRFWYDVKMRTLHSDGFVHKEKIMSTITLKYGPKNYRDWAEGTDRNYYDRVDVWTKRTTPELVALGYKKAKGLYSSLIFSGVPIYCKIENAREYDGSKIMEDGLPEISKDTASTLADFLHSNADAKFIKGMGKKKMDPLDTQKFIMMGAVGFAAVLGLWWLGVF